MLYTCVYVSTVYLADLHVHVHVNTCTHTHVYNMCILCAISSVS